jgi:hypothetical protein
MDTNSWSLRTFLLGIGLTILVVVPTIRAYSQFTCGSSKPWKVVKEDNHAAERTIQNWIRARQNEPKFCLGGRITSITAVRDGGIGASVYYFVCELMSQLEQGVIYRPEIPKGYMWADSDPSKCSFGKRLPDCYYDPYTYCTVQCRYDFGYIPAAWNESGRLVDEPGQPGTKVRKVARYDISEADKFSKVGLDVCHVAEKLQVSGGVRVNCGCLSCLTNLRRCFLETCGLGFRSVITLPNSPKTAPT